ncbi:DEAD/DEAH box helicase family protein [Cytobacillus oceanisediminis]|uniref:DEAD/DEAH box helicase family protein n=1 Tax=Cytobacillus oceanisediminis TaxID=665099 RepID=UPI001C234D18|nr:DEAD/DEAH box helicase family protein [Cytobacillus oceanisediminis]MBU8730762.1 DEAD/DEAH box helicase family protein [Cytobacillus oceanisediminis]
MSKYVNTISARLSLRKPQKESLEILSEVVELLKLQKHDANSLKIELEKIQSLYPTITDFERDFPSLCFALATGVGKTRLMGAFISYLYISKGMKNFFVLAPNLTIYNKLINDFTPGTSKYVFKGIPELISNQPRIITGDNYDSGLKVIKNSLLDDEIHINIFNISKINSEVRGGKSPRIKRLSEYIGESYFEYLSSLPDLVLLMDESHRYRATAGVNVLNELKPVLGLELTATPQVESGRRTTPFNNVIYSYPLHKAMEDGFVKEPSVATRENFNASEYSKEQLERLKLEDGIIVHEETKVELDLYSRQSGQPLVKPFILIVAQDTSHAQELINTIESDEFFGGRYKGRVITVHSNQRGEEKDETILELMELEDPKSQTEIVIHVNMLKEGWDVTNLYTIIPLRAANSKTLVEQSIGRGLRLPFGKRTGVEAVDRLTIIAHDRFQEIVDEANNPNSIIRSGVIIGKDIGKEKKQPVTIPPTSSETIKNEVESKIVEDIVKKNPETKEVFTSERVQKVIDLTNETIKKYEYLPSSKTLQKEEIKAEIIREVRSELVIGELDLFPEETNRFVSQVVETAINHNIQHSIDIPRVVIQPIGEVSWGFQHFELDVRNVRLQPVEEKIILQQLRTNQRSVLHSNTKSYKEDRLENYIVAQLMNYPDISYDDHAELLYNLGGQLVTHLQSYLSDNDAVENVLIYHQATLAERIHEQMQQHYYQDSEGGYDVKVSKGFEQLAPVHYTMSIEEGERNFRSPVEDKSRIKSMVFSGFTKCLYRTQKFDSDSERRFSVICENDPNVLKWFKPSAGQLKIYYGRGETYHPDFVVETTTLKLICEIKSKDEMKDEVVIEKAKAVTAWCEHASKHEKDHEGKEWIYLLIPHSNVSENMTVEGLKNLYQFRTETIS